MTNDKDKIPEGWRVWDEFARRGISNQDDIKASVEVLVVKFGKKASKNWIQVQQFIGNWYESCFLTRYIRGAKTLGTCSDSNYRILYKDPWEVEKPKEEEKRKAIPEFYVPNVPYFDTLWGGLIINEAWTMKGLTTTGGSASPSPDNTQIEGSTNRTAAKETYIMSAAVYSKKALVEALTAAKTKHVKAIDDGMKEAKVAVAKLADKFIAKGGAMVSTDEPVLLASSKLSGDSYDRALAQLALLSGDEIAGNSLSYDVLGLIENAGVISSGKKTLSLG